VDRPPPAIGIGVSTFEHGIVDGLYGPCPTRWDGIAELVETAGQMGIASAWFPDHLLFREPGVGIGGTWEVFSLIAGLAARTRHIALGTLVASNLFRNPALLAKMADTIDEISNGRFILGISSGGRWRDEYDAFGYPFDHRLDRFEESLQILAPLLRTGRVDFEGTWVQARDCELRPRGPREGDIPILIGTLKHGPRLLRDAARFADIWAGWIAFGNSWPDAIAPALPNVDAACEEVGRDPATLKRFVTVSWRLPNAQSAPGYEPQQPLSGPIPEIAAAIRQFGALGIDEVQIIPNPCTLQGLESFGALIRELER
jgi:alkanesulfonate monooxygenase SsuD/methylene tetrahydromethanopterin reductase-like flavin-dependent oxidoreductase (luciferase family)